MKNGKFELGDKVRFVANDYSKNECVVGQEGVVTDINSAIWPYHIKLNTGRLMKFVGAGDLELVTAKPKVGDTVKIKDTSFARYGGSEFVANCTGVITEIKGPCHRVVDNGMLLRKCFYENELEVITPKETKEETKRMFKKGDKVKVTAVKKESVKNNRSWDKWLCGMTVLQDGVGYSSLIKVQALDGQCGEIYSSDIELETPQFKVGDYVIAPQSEGYPYQRVGKVTEVYSYGSVSLGVIHLSATREKYLVTDYFKVGDRVRVNVDGFEVGEGVIRDMLRVSLHGYSIPRYAVFFVSPASLTTWFYASQLTKVPKEDPRKKEAQEKVAAAKANLDKVRLLEKQAKHTLEEVTANLCRFEKDVKDAEETLMILSTTSAPC